MDKIYDWVVEQHKPARFGDWKAQDIEVLNNLHLLTAKTGVVLVNMSEQDFVKKKSPWLPKIKAWIDEHSPGEQMIPFCGTFEAKLIDLDEEQRETFLKERGTQSNVPRITKTGYSALNLIHFFTCGEDEVKCWTVRRFTKAPQAAGTIHSDMEHGFICAEVMRYNDLKELGSEAALRSGGKLGQQGKNYEIDDADICYFKFNVTSKGKSVKK
jgi:obg-like ATPase 1